MQRRIVAGVAIGVMIGVFAAVSPGRPGFATEHLPPGGAAVAGVAGVGAYAPGVGAGDRSDAAADSASSRSRSTASLTSRYQR